MKLTRKQTRKQLDDQLLRCGFDLQCAIRDIRSLIIVLENKQQVWARTADALRAAREVLKESNK